VGVKRFMTGVGCVVLLVPLAALAFGVVNFFRLFIAKTSGTETIGSYHEPVSTAVTVGSGVVGGILALLFLVAAVMRVDDKFFGRAIVGGLTLSILTAVAGFWLPYVHTNEIDVGPTGFRQPYYMVPRTDQVTIYNATSLPMTLCVGIRSHCQPSRFAPGSLNGAGLRLTPGQAVDLVASGSDHEENDVPMASADWAAYAITITTPMAGMTQLDTSIHALKGCNDYADNSDC
jgi:hypothetical protein